MRKAKLLLAMNRPYLPLVEAALADYEILPATTLSQAEKLIFQDGIDMCIISVHFDDSRAVDLIRLIRESKNHRHTPICILRLMSTQNAAYLKHTMITMQLTQEVGEYLELNDDPEFAEKIKSAVQRQLTESGPASTTSKPN
jgi:response regulator RpfG family c-di-GMP phosphodiesterase